MPLHKIEDLFSGDQVMIGCLISLLLKRWERNGKKNPNDPLVHKSLGVIKRQNFDVQARGDQILIQQCQEIANITYQPHHDPQLKD